MEEERRGTTGRLIEKATDSTAAEVDPRLLKAIKSAVRSSDSELRLAATTLMSLMKRDHSQVRYLALLIIDELFMRSKIFRGLVVENLDRLLSLSVGFGINVRLPAPPTVASVLRSKAIEFLEKWNSKFGFHYKQLRLGFDYLKNTRRFQFPNVQENATRAQLERRKRGEKSKEILLKKFKTLKENLSSIKEEIQSTVDEIGECLDIVSSTGDQFSSIPLDDESFEEFRSFELQQIRMDALKEGQKVHENSENKVVFDALRELYKLLATKHLVSVQDWISVLIKVEISDNRLRDSMLKEFIDIRNHLLSVKKKCEESGCTLLNIGKHEEEGEEEDFWEECKIELVETGSSSMYAKKNVDPSMASTSSMLKSKDVDDSHRVSTADENPGCGGGRNISKSTRSKLLAEAPVRKEGSFVHTWGLNRDALANQRGLEFDGHWGRVDFDAVIPAEKIAELNVQATVYKEDEVDIQPCRAPLRKGGLCGRKDLRICPFHGPIIPRDNEGKPINQISLEEDKNINKPTSEDARTSEDDETLDLGMELKRLAKQAVKNVQSQNREEARKRKTEVQSLKRAKLARIRDHNETVIRDAALDPTSSFSGTGEAVEASIGAKNKKQTLASMLRKKVTVKDRLGQKLLNNRVKDATVRQLTLGDHANYKEAFPNQW